MQSPSSDAAAPSPADGVRVSVRVRPLNAREKAAIAESKVSWSIDSSSITQCVNTKPVPANCFHFDHVFEQHITNEQIFVDLAKPVVTSATDGINGVIFAYGQTAAGKTYTMLGTESDAGVTRRSIAEVFRLISSCPNRQFLLRASYIEIYNEVIRDLLVPDNVNLKIHEDVINKRVFVDSREEVVTSVGQVMDIISRGEATRAVGETNMNDRSSRSHTIFSLKIESREMSPAEIDGEESGGDDGVAVRASTLSLVDLAGSERASFTKAQGMRLVEGGHINKSLLTLGTVINKLSSGVARTSAHIPYRDSKLTRLLQPALGGNARTAIVCAVTPAILHMEETLSTLKFASRAKKVTNQAKTNEFLDDRAKLRRAEKEIARLKVECQRRKGSGTFVSPNTESIGAEFAKETREWRLASFEKKFDVLLKNIRASEKPSKPGILNIAMASPTLTNALDLSDSRNISVEDHVDSNSEFAAKTVELRRRVFEAEKEKRQAFAEINYERQAMIAEVEVLLATSEEAERARHAAERECAETNSKLANKLVGSMVDEIVTEVMTTSLMSGKLKEVTNSLSELNNVYCENTGLKQDLGVLHKEHAEVLKREKRGVGPVLKEVRFLQSKLSDLEKKQKSLRQAVTKANSEKAAVERELKNRERQNKVLNGEVAKHRNHNSKGQARAGKEFANERKMLESNFQEMKAEISALSGSLRDKDKELASVREQITKGENELGEVLLARDNLRETNSTLAIEIAEIQRNLESSEAARNDAFQEIAQLRSKEALSISKVTELTEELGKAHVEVEELKLELSELLKGADNSESGRLAAISVQEEAERSLSEMKKARDEMESLLQTECAEKEKALQDLALKEKTATEQNTTIDSLDKYVEKYKAAHELLQSQLVQANNDMRTLQVHQADLERENEVLKSMSCRECQSLNDQIVALQENILVMEHAERPAVDSKTAKLEEQVRTFTDECGALHRNVEKLMAETKTRTKEVLKLTKTIQVRDQKICAMEDTLEQLGRGEGKIAVLQKRCHRRELMIGELNRRLELQEEILKEGEVPGLFKSAQRVLELESKNAALHIEQRQLEEDLENLQTERTRMVDETRRLRDKIKDRDIQRVREASQRKEAQHDEMRRKNDVLRNLSLNGDWK